MKVFLTGTEYLQKMNNEMWTKIHNITKLEVEILIGNYRGFDKLALTFLTILQYPNVTVYETGSNLSFGYPLVFVGRYPAQDILMSKQANYMLAVYDGKSRGVRANLKRMSPNRIRIIRV
ncbi:hypothetical protein QUB05_07365 [Microcoleus sp. F10-C6]|uniref:hypothetical protein n=1 Tax=unclassified Microcoleus TaxID=2642155 RepID=UPI002FD49586